MRRSKYEYLILERCVKSEPNYLWRVPRNDEIGNYQRRVDWSQKQASRGLRPKQRQRGRGPISYLIDYQLNQADNEIVPNSRHALATGTVDVVPTLFMKILSLGLTLSILDLHNKPPRRGRGRRWGWGPRDRPNPFEYCMYHHFYNHDIADYRDIARYPIWASPQNNRRNDSPQFT